MTGAREVWDRAAELFDELVTLEPAERAAILEQRTVPAAVRAWLDELLAAHDSDRTLIVDREIDRLVGRLLPSLAVSAAHEDFTGRRFGPWRALREIGRGGSGVVLAGERADGQFQMQVAIKLLDPNVFGPSLEALFRRELRILAELSHPNIAQLLDGGVAGDETLFLVMEYIPGRAIDEHCRVEGLRGDARIELFLQVAEAVAHCHRHLVVHGDIKPSNVLIDAEGRPRLLDFGIASRLVTGQPLADSGERARWCSPGYAAPERLRGAAPAAAEDVFALGALLYQLLTDSRIRSAPEMTRLLRGKSPAETPPPPSERAHQRGLDSSVVHRLRGDLDAILGQALSADVDARYHSVEALIADLRRWRAGYPVHARAGGRAYRFHRWVGRNRVVAGAAAAVVIALVAGAGVALWQAERARAEARRVEQALAETRQALERVTALREYVVELFATAEPTRPRDQLPTTREILATGAERALNDNELSAGERYELLLTVGRIYDSLNLPDRATELLEPAVALARREDALDPGDLARALRRLAWSVARERDMERVDDLLAEAIDAASAAGDEKLGLQLRADRGFMQYASGERARGRETLEAARRRLARIEAPDPELVYAVMNPLGIALRGSGELAAAIGAYQQAAEAAALAYGIESQRHAMARSNLASARMDWGWLAEAEEELNALVDLYARIYVDQPSENQGAALTNLARVRLRLGRFDEAAATMAEGRAIWDRAMDQEPGTSAAAPLDSGWIHLRAHAWSKALAAAQRARKLLQADAAAMERFRARALVLAANARCRLGRPATGMQQLGQFEARFAEILPLHKNLQADHLEAVAVCHLAGGRHERALDTAREALDLLQRGWVLQHTDLRLVAARALDSLGRGDAAQAELEAAQERLAVLDLPRDHPAFAWINNFASWPDR